MFKKLLHAQGLLLLLLVIINSMVILSVRKGLIDFNNQELPPAPDGMVYMEYCDGGTSDFLAVETDKGCIADNPGDFAITATASLSIIFFVLFSIGYALILFLKKLIHPKETLTPTVV